MFLLFNLVCGIFMNIAGHTWALIALVEPQTSLAYNAEAMQLYRWRQVDTYPVFADILFKQFICLYLIGLRIVFWLAKKIFARGRLKKIDLYGLVWCSRQLECISLIVPSSINNIKRHSRLSKCTTAGFIIKPFIQLLTVAGVLVHHLYGTNCTYICILFLFKKKR